MKKSFNDLKAKARENEVIKNYLDSFQSVMGQEIFKLRINRRLSQSDLAKMAKTNQATISRIEAGDPGIKGETYDKVLKALRAPRIRFDHDEEQTTDEEKDKAVLV
jgi:transcriptional regulator with XRE-family HTH domain